MTRIDERKKVIISLLTFFVVLAALLVAATFTDLQVSRILTKNALPEQGMYLADGFFGVTLEIWGSSPVYLMIAFCGVVLFWHFMKNWKLKPLKYVLSVAMFAVCTAAFWFFFKDIVGYILEHAGNEEIKHDAAVVASEVLTALVLASAAVLAGKSLKEETIGKLLKFVLAFAVMAVVANVLIMVIKEPMGRMRFRAMNSSFDSDFAGFTRWYEINGERVPTRTEMLLWGWADDAFKSFPSGHTCAAGMSYALIMLPDALKIEKKGARAACWIVPIVFTGLVAISRIVVGAHFFSDVLFGGTIAFACMIIVREIFICRFSHLKCLKKKPLVQTAETEE